MLELGQVAKSSDTLAFKQIAQGLRGGLIRSAEFRLAIRVIRRRGDGVAGYSRSALKAVRPESVTDGSPSCLESRTP